MAHGRPYGVDIKYLRYSMRSCSLLAREDPSGPLAAGSSDRGRGRTDGPARTGAEISATCPLRRCRCQDPAVPAWAARQWALGTGTVAQWHGSGLGHSNNITVLESWTRTERQCSSTSPALLDYTIRSTMPLRMLESTS
ncbi:hypothetical protein T310_2548 [Rasamsonia emersonii CBS 393.64]|uniref:Uncharacterized protein n=1 Tax=Rasamsonia emersonii (strain ATCC 16479 / CBS 393.64 / IMI 116815) TaxID=1408163 RepID=A0A0F4YYW0_RASE3|nr:hypothetical protein T310_2548 [Rasamsonia emersonii CBS 393.64]KKA23482.1 hypothetical protein T310_2548 [Rasamsonia emersonii CBS 393.64]